MFSIITLIDLFLCFRLIFKIGGQRNSYPLLQDTAMYINGETFYSFYLRNCFIICGILSAVLSPTSLTRRSLPLSFHAKCTKQQTKLISFLNFFKIKLKVRLQGASGKSKKTPIWVYIVAALGGLLLLAIIFFLLFRVSKFSITF